MSTSSAPTIPASGALQERKLPAPRERSTDIRYINKLRIIAIYAVVTGHVTIWQTLETEHYTFNWFLGCWVHWLCRASVPIFVMISGALLLDDSRRETASAFYRRRAQRIGLPLIFWTVFYLMLRQTVGAEQLTARSVLYLIVTVQPYYHLWFLYMIAGLSLLTPAIRTFVRGADRTQRLLVIGVIFVLGEGYAQANVLYWNHPRLLFTVFLPFIAYYMCGYELRLLDPKKIPLKVLIAAVVACLVYVIAIFAVFMDLKNVKNNDFLLEFFSPPVILLSIGIFWAAYLMGHKARPGRASAKGLVPWIASTTLGVYVLHPAVLEFLRIQFSEHAGEGTFVAGITLVPFVTFAGSCLITTAMMKVPILRRTVC